MKVDCSSGHTGAVYQGAPKACASCHAEPAIHKDRFGTDCARRHSPTSWKSDRYDKGLFVSSGFDHDRTGFALRDVHAAIDCKSCHVKDSFTGLSRSCVSCHAEPQAHAGKFGLDCGNCHGTNTWRAATLHPAALVSARFDHGATEFPLTGKHATADCRSCHVGSRFVGTPRACVACHEEPTSHKPHPRSFGENCAQCHSTTSWQGATLFEHTFPMNHGMRRKGNVNSACSTCHPATQTSFTAAKATPSYSSYTCYGCHQHSREKEARRRAHQKATNLDKCASCHRFGGGRRQISDDFPGFVSSQGCPEAAGSDLLTSCPSSDFVRSSPRSRLGRLPLVGRPARPAVALTSKSAGVWPVDAPGRTALVDFLRIGPAARRPDLP